MHWLLHVLGIDNVSGTAYAFWSGFAGDLAIVAAVGASGWALVRKAVQHHKASLSQAERHHAEHLTQLLAHHNALVHLHERHHGRLLDAVAAAAPPAAEPQVSAGSRSQPGSMGLNAESALVPPAAAKRTKRTRRTP